MVAKSSSTKKTTTKRPAAKKTSSAVGAKRGAKRIDYYPNRVPLLAVVTGVSFLMLITLIVTL